MYFYLVVIAVCLLCGGIFFQFLSDDYYVILSLLSIICYIASTFLFVAFVIMNAGKSNLNNKNIAKELDTQIYYIQGYATSTNTKDNTYYKNLIEEVNKYNQIYNNYAKDTKTFKVEPKESFANYQSMIYNYETNTITWKDGTVFLKGDNNNG